MVSITPWPLNSQGESRRYPLDRRSGGPQSRDSNCDPIVAQAVASRYADIAILRLLEISGLFTNVVNTYCLCFLRPPLWSSGQSFWLQIQKSGFYSRRHHIFEELLGRKSIGSRLEIREYSRRDPSRWPYDTLYPQKLALTSPTSGCRSVGIVRSRTQATAFLCF
jgi:hypothetical protein